MSTERPGERKSFDDEIDRAWRRHADEQPSERVNAAILAAARKPRARVAGWQPLAAAATVAALAFLLVQLMPRERNVEQPISVEPASPAATGKMAPAGTHTAPAAQASAAAPAKEVASPRAESRAKADTTPRLEIPTGAPASAEADANRSRPAVALSAGVPAPPQPGDSNVPERAANEAKVAPQQWAMRIEALYQSGDIAAATSELRRFRAARADADAFLPESLRTWASTIH
jgi:hypothetical protein